MAAFPLSLLLGSSTFKVRNKTRQLDVMSKVKVLGTKVTFSSTAMRHMREDGTTIVDTRIVNPFMMEVDIICPDINVATEVLGILADRKSLYRITSKGLILDNMMMMYDSMRQTPENLSSAPTRIVFQQVILQVADESKSNGQQPITAQPADSSLLDRGISAVKDVAKAATETVSQAVGGLFDRATNAVGIANQVANVASKVTKIANF